MQTYIERIHEAKYQNYLLSIGGNRPGAMTREQFARQVFSGDLVRWDGQLCRVLDVAGDQVKIDQRGFVAWVRIADLD